MTLYLARYLIPVLSPPLEDGALLVQDGRIADLGSRKRLLADYPAAERVELGEAILLPPLVNAHTHLELTHFPDWAHAANEVEEPGTFVDWMLRVIRIKRSLDPDLFLPSLQAGLSASLAAGTGAVGDILSYFPAREVYGDSPLKGRYYLETLGRDPLPCRRVLKKIIQLAGKGRCGFLAAGLAPHSPYSLSAEYLERVFDAARRNRLAATIHLAEAPAESEFIRLGVGELAERLYPFVGWQGMVPPGAGCSPVRYVEEKGGLAPSTLVVHGVQVEKEDVARLASSGATVALCPRSNERLGVGAAPVERYLEAGVPLALGTDSLASCDSLSIWDEIAFARKKFAGILDAERLLEMATIGGARALGLEGELGALACGWGGHFQVLRPGKLPRSAELFEFCCEPGRTAEVQALYLDGTEQLQKG